MIGTDRRYTTLKLKSSRDVKLAMFHDTFVYTETPQNLKTYISQRKRWGTNTLSNSLVNISSRNIPWFTKLSAIVDILRLIASYFRFVSFIFFWVFLFIGDIKLELIIFLAITIGTVYLYTFVSILAVGEKRFSLLYGFMLNKIITPLITVRIFTEILLNFDDFSWGDTQKVKGFVHHQELDQLNKLNKANQLNEIIIQPSELKLQIDINDEHNRFPIMMIEDDATSKTIPKYNHIKDICETEDGLLYIASSDCSPKKRFIEQKDLSHPKYADHPIRTIDTIDTIDTNRIPKEKNEVGHDLLHNSSHSYRPNSQRKFIRDDNRDIHKLSIRPIPTRLRELDAYGIDETEDDTSDVEPKYSIGWKEEHFPKRTKTRNNKPNNIPQPPPIPPKSRISDNTNNTNNTSKQSKFKKLHWKLLPPSTAKKSFWKLSDSPMLESKYCDNGKHDEIHKEIKFLFEINQMPKVRKSHKSRKSKTLVSLKHANTAGIILKRVRVRFQNDKDCLDVIMKSLIHLNPKQISSDQIRSFMTFLPLEKEEINNLKEYNRGNGESNLIFADNFYIGTLVVPRIYQRLKCELIKRTIGIDINHFIKYCTLFQNICVELKESCSFRKLLTKILEIGKIMNNQEFNNQKAIANVPIIGFKLESLGMLKQTKTTVSASQNSHKSCKSQKSQKIKTLLDYILNRISIDDP
ncbi:MAG: hypothetical protein KAR20_27475, partial [Candidatus Heimdallarchaeota archaeon]|nr:hypothetical protein [Candidatus Heimdallarchaeota archaeon]